jgi:hypothetical protein
MAASHLESPDRGAVNPFTLPASRRSVLTSA